MATFEYTAIAYVILAWAYTASDALTALHGAHKAPVYETNTFITLDGREVELPTLESIIAPVIAGGVVEVRVG